MEELQESFVTFQGKIKEKLGIDLQTIFSNIYSDRFAVVSNRQLISRVRKSHKSLEKQENIRSFSVF